MALGPRSTFLPAALLAASIPAAAAAGPAVTAYTRDLGFVREWRTLEISALSDTVLLGGVPERLDFSSVRLSPEGAARVARLAYRYDVANGDGLLEKARGSRVRVTLRGDRSIEGTLLGADGAWLLVREEDGSLHTLARGSADDVRLLGFPRASLRPSLEAVVVARSKGRLRAELSYLTGGLSWSAEHTVVRKGESVALWSSSVTVDNSTGMDFVDADLKLVAGEPSREGPAPMPVPMGRVFEMSAQADKSADLNEQAFAEYHLYTLEHAATLRDRESQRLTMLEPREAKLRPRYPFRGSDPRGVRVQLEGENSAASGLGVPLPAGRVRFYEADPSGALQFTGETRIGHTAENEKLTLDVGIAFDLAAERREVQSRRISDREREYAVEISLRNRKPKDVSIVVEENVPGDYEITQKTHDFTRKDANTIQFVVPVGAGKEVKVGYTVRARF